MNVAKTGVGQRRTYAFLSRPGAAHPSPSHQKARFCSGDSFKWSSKSGNGGGGAVTGSRALRATLSETFRTVNQRVKVR